MTLSPIYLQKLEEVRQEGIQEGRQETQRSFIEGLLKLRFGSLDEELNAIVEPLSILTTDESLPLLTQLSREELLNRFSQA